MSAEKKPYEVGYGRPPKSTQFQKGQSGNTKGRPRSAKNLATLVNEEMLRKVEATENGKKIVLPKIVVLVKSMFAKAAKGDIRAMQFLATFLQQAENDRDRQLSNQPLADEDLAMLNEYLASRLSAKGGSDDQY